MAASYIILSMCSDWIPHEGEQLSSRQLWATLLCVQRCSQLYPLHSCCEL